MANKASSDYLISLSKSTTFYNINELVLVYAIVEENVGLSILSQYPVVDFDFSVMIRENEAQEKNLYNFNNPVEEKLKETELPNGLA
jgi:hypothetical protein